MKKILLSSVLFALLNVSVAHAQVGRAWAWEAGKISSNGSVSIQSNNGSSSITATQNPVGAVAKVNQSAITQPPTIIIQATSGTSTGTTQKECTITRNVSGTVTQPTPSCPVNYSSTFTQSGYSCTTPTFYNVGGSGMTFGVLNGNYVGFSMEKAFTNPAVGNSIDVNSYQYCSGSVYWAYNLCCK